MTLSRLLHRALALLAFASLSVGFAACSGDGGTSPSLFTSNFQGRWSGSIAVTSCKATGAANAEGVCTFLTGGPFNMTLTQSGRTVTAVFDFGGEPAPQTSGEIDSAGKLQFTSTADDVGGRVTVTWYLSLVNNLLAGSMDARAISTNPADGEVAFSGTITRAVRER